MGIIDIIKKGFSIVHRNLGLLVVVFVFNLIATLVRLPFTPAAPVGSAATPPSLPLIGLTFLFGILGIFVFGGVLGYLKEYIKTQAGNLNNFISSGSQYFLRILGVWVLVAVVVMFFGMIGALGLSIGIAVKNLIGTVLAIAFVLIAGGIGVYLFMLMIMSPYVVVADGLGPVSAIKKSIDFVRKSLLKVVGLFLLLMLISLGIGFLVGVVVGVLTLILKGAGAKVLIAIIGSAFNAYVNVLIPSCFLLFYMTSSKAKQEAAPTPGPAGPTTT